MASAGTGSVSHVSGALFTVMAGVEVNHVPHRINFIADLLSGQVQVAVTTITLSALPDIPTVGEFVPGYDAAGWYGVGAPKSTPADIVDKLNRKVNAGLADTKLKARLADVGVEPTPMTPADSASSSPTTPRSGAR